MLKILRVLLILIEWASNIHKPPGRLLGNGLMAAAIPFSLAYFAVLAWYSQVK